MSEYTFKGEEKIVLSLRSLYTGWGYRPFRMRRFEEYDLYRENKDFLVSGNVITFTDTDGKLMALKPDVTLSIVKSVREGRQSVSRICYDESVYRVSDLSGSFREITQTGVECIGQIGTMERTEVVLLAQKSLLSISSSSMLVLSHMGIVKDFLSRIPQEKRALTEEYLSSRNTPAIKALSEEEDRDAFQSLIALLDLSGEVDTVIPSLKALGAREEAVEELASVLSALDKEKVRIDFSVIGSLGYYNGLVFRGYVDGIPSSVVSGGQYDKLLERMGRKEKAIGFAVYLDALERLCREKEENDGDIVLLVKGNPAVADVMAKAENLRTEGTSVVILRQIPEGFRYGSVVEMGGEDA